MRCPLRNRIHPRAIGFACGFSGNTHDNHDGAERNDEDIHMAASQLTQPPRTPYRALGNNLRDSRYQDRTRKVHRATFE